MYYIIQSRIQTEDTNVMINPNSGWWLPPGVEGKWDWGGIHRGFNSFCNTLVLRLVGETVYSLHYSLCFTPFA